MVKIKANGNEIALLTSNTDYISLTDIAKYRDSENPRYIIQNWLGNKSTIEFLGVWEQMDNLNFKLVEFDQFKSEAGLNSFLMSPKKWIETTNAVGIKSTAGRYGGTYAHSDIAFEFASWISPEFKLYIIQDYQRLKQEESYKNKLEWQTNRYISKLNYTIHTDAIKNNLITPTLTTTQIRHKYASEADILNMALYGMTAKEFKNKYPEKEGNLRDNSTIEQLMIMNNLQILNADMLKSGVSSEIRLQKLNEIAIEQQNILIKNNQKALQELKKLK